MLDALLKAAANSDFDAVQTLLDQHGNSFTHEDLQKAYHATKPHYVPGKFGNDSKIKAKILTCCPNLEFFTQLAERGRSDLSSTLYHLPLEYIQRLSLQSTPTIVNLIGIELYNAGKEFLRGGHEDFNNLVKKSLQFDNRLLMQWAIDSTNPDTVECFTKIGVKFQEKHNGKTPLEIAKERADADIARVLIKASGESGRVTTHEWREILKKEDDLLRQRIEAIITKSAAHQIRTAAQVALQPSGLLLSPEQLAIVEEYFKDPSHSKYSKDDKVPYSVVKTQEGDLFAIYSEQEQILESTRIGAGCVAKIKFGQNLRTQECCAIKILEKPVGIVTHEANMLKRLNQYRGICLAKRGNGTDRSFLFMPFIDGISWLQYVQNKRLPPLKPRHQAIIFHNLLLAIQHLCKNNINHNDAHYGNFMIDPKDFSFTFIDFASAELMDASQVKLNTSSYTRALHLMYANIYGPPELHKIYDQLKSSDDNILVAIEKALTETQAFIDAARTLPEECILQQPPVLLSNPLQPNTNKRAFESIEPEDTNPAGDAKQARKSL